MTIESNLRDEAEQAAYSIQSRIEGLEREIELKSAERAQLVNELNQARMASHRLEKYPVVHGSSVLCPYCWIGTGRLSPLTRTRYGDDREALRCESCLTELQIEPVAPSASSDSPA